MTEEFTAEKARSLHKELGNKRNLITYEEVIEQIKTEIKQEDVTKTNFYFDYDEYSEEYQAEQIITKLRKNGFEVTYVPQDTNNSAYINIKW